MISLKIVKNQLKMAISDNSQSKQAKNKLKPIHMVVLSCFNSLGKLKPTSLILKNTPKLTRDSLTVSPHIFDI